MLQQNYDYVHKQRLFNQDRIYFCGVLVITLLFFQLAQGINRERININVSNLLRDQTSNNSITTPLQTSTLKYQNFLPLISQQVPSDAYYVSPTGDNSNPGTLELPWRTISKAAKMAYPGMTVYIRGGIYSEVVEVRASGTENQPIRFLAFSGETPIIDGYNQKPTYWVGLFSMLGDWIQVSGIEARNSMYDGFGLYGKHDTAHNVYAHHNQYHGVMIKGDYGTVENSRFWRNSLMNEYGVSGNGSSALYVSKDFDNGIADYAVVHNNVVWENWGEGISTAMANQAVIENNTSHDNYAANIYINDSTNILIQSNFVYMNPESYVYGHGSNVGIMMGNEKYSPPSSNITIINNLAYGNNRNLYWWRGVQGGGMVNVLIAHNTFVNSVGTSGVIFMSGAHQNVQFRNNLTLQGGDLPVIRVDDPAGIVFSNNLWSKAPPPNYPYPLPEGDIIGDPILAQVGTPYQPSWYILTRFSPAINNSIALSVTSTDFFSNPRDDYPDIGGIEYINAP